MCTRFGCALQESVLPVLRKLCNQIPLAFKVTFSGCPPSLCQFPRLESLLSALELLQQCKNSFGMIVFQYVGHLLGISAVGPMATSSSWTYATCCASLVCCSQSPRPCGRPLVIHSSAGDTQTLKGNSGSLSCASHGSFPWVLGCTRFCLHLLTVSGRYEV